MESDPPTSEPTANTGHPRRPVVRGEGSTESERHLARLAEHSFLDLWSYPNPFRDDKPDASGDGKEVCDLLVVCGRHVIIFSEKNISWSADKPLNVAWPRWYKKAVLASVKQIKGAEKWISEHPDRIFVDPKCTTRIPIDFPAAAERTLHRIVVARGAGEACIKHFDGGSGSFVIRPDIKDDAHWNDGCEPFVIGDIDSNGSYVHVLDDATLDVLMVELDTITDFTDYLTRKENFIRRGRLAIANGEEDLLAYYAVRTNSDGDHDFTHPEDRPWKDGEVVGLDGSHYSSLVNNPQYLARKEADQKSYLWDALISQFTKHMLDGTSVRLDGSEPEINKSEIAVRYMALEPRFYRRAHAEGILGAIEAARGKEIFLRSMLRSEKSKDKETGFFFLQMSFDDKLKASGKSYDDYRLARSNYALTYAQGILVRFPYLKRIIGVAMAQPESGQSNSEDLVFAERAEEWSEEAKQEIQRRCDELGIMRRDMEFKNYTGQEYPDVSPRDIPRGFADFARGGEPKSGETRPRNRAERRALAARRKK